MKTKIFSLLVITVMAFSLTACGGTTESTDTGSSAETQTQEEADASEESEETEEATDEGDLGDYYVKIGKASFTKDYEGNKVIVINFDFTNNSEEKASAMWSLGYTAFQNGVELETAIVDDDSYDLDKADKEIKTGVTLEKCQVAYVLEDDSPVEFEVSELVSLSDDTLTKTFEVKE
ncbi:MAG: DUF5067 domain-containing protein [Eubacterium sp.]|nr:DUF5067 domain-containing protein [Eubacterium sp.]